MNKIIIVIQCIGETIVKPILIGLLTVYILVGNMVAIVVLAKVLLGYNTLWNPYNIFLIPAVLFTLLFIGISFLEYRDEERT